MMTAPFCCMVMLASALPAADDPWGAGFTAYRTGRYADSVAPLEQIAASGPAENAIRALIMLASTARMRGEADKAAGFLDQAVEKYSSNHWGPRAAGDLVNLYLSQKNYPEAEKAVERFLAIYLPTASATIDDAVCTDMFRILMTCRNAAAPAAGSDEAMRLLRTRYPATSPIGRVVAWNTRGVPVTAGDNLLLNGGFELDGKALGTPIGWTYRGTEPEPFDDCDGVISGGKEGELLRSAEGGFCTGKFTSYGRHRGWLFQRVPVIAGRTYEVSAQVMTPAEQGSPGAVRVGVDLTGGGEPESESIRWSETVSHMKAYTPVSFAGANAVTATGDHLTVFLEFRQETPAAPNAMLVDEVVVREVRGNQ